MFMIGKGFDGAKGANTGHVMHGAAQLSILLLVV
jgi:hypothetical protein